MEIRGRVTATRVEGRYRCWRQEQPGLPRHGQRDRGTPL